MNIAVKPRAAGSLADFELREASLQSGLERRRLQSYLAIMLGDIAMLLLGFVTGGYLYLGHEGVNQGLVLGQLVLPAFLTIALYNSSYSLDTLQRPFHGIARALMAMLLSSAVVIFIAFYTKSSRDFSRVSFTGGVLFACMLIPWMRMQLRAFVAWRCGQFVVNELVIDDGGPVIDLPHVRRVDAARFSLVPDSADPVALDRIGGLLRNVDRVIISCPPERRHAWAMICKGAAIEGEVIDDTIAELDALGARLAGGRGLLLVSVGPLGLRMRALKRIFDLAIAIPAIIACSPLLLIVALAIKLSDGGPVLFVQRRMGLGNTFFDMLKFRSMAVSASDQAGAVSTARDDARVTRIGNFIRRTSIDELPQLFNVLFGDMSVVGPRPHAIGSQAGDKLFWEVDARYWQRHALKPGMTGLAQIRGLRGATSRESDLASRLSADLEYLNGWSIWRDAAILVATLRVIVHEKAY